MIFKLSDDNPFEISNFNSSVYYSNPDHLRCPCLEGKRLA